MNRRDLLLRLAVPLILAAVTALMAPAFLTTANLANVLRQAALATPLALGMTATMIMGGLDLSVGSVATVAAVVGAMLLVAGHPWLAVLAAVLTGGACGAFNGLLVGPLRLPAVVATYGMMRIAKGLALVMTGGLSIYGIRTTGFLWMGQGYLGPVPAPLLIALVVIGGAVLLLQNTTFGRQVYGTGANPEAAHFSGIPTNRVYVATYMLSGMLAALAGLLYTAKLGAADATMGDPWAIDALAAAVIGGAPFTGGEGSVVGGALGVLTLAILNNGLTLTGVPANWQSLVKGLLIVLAVGADLAVRRRSVAELFRHFWAPKAGAPHMINPQGE